MGGCEKWEAFGESERKENERPWVDVSRCGRPLVNLNDNDRPCVDMRL